MSVFPFLQSNIVWFLGPAASGKSTSIEWIRTRAQESSLEFRSISDLTVMIQMISEDSQEKYHKKLPNDQFIITDESIYDLVMNRVSIEAEALSRTCFVCVEVSVGLGLSDRLSLKRRIQFIPDMIKSQSIFVYVKNTDKRRESFNLKRKGVFQTPPEVYKKYFMHDDVESTLQTAGCRWYIAKNYTGKKELSVQLTRILTHERCSK